MAERVSLDDLDAELIHKLKACKDDQELHTSSGSTDADSVLGKALQDQLNVVVHKLDLQMELLQRLAFDDIPDIPEPPEMNQFSFSRNVSPSDDGGEFQVGARGTDKTVASQLLATYTEDDRQRRDTAQMMNSSQTRRRFSRIAKSPQVGDSHGCCFWMQLLVAHPGFEMFWAFVVLSNAVVLGIDVEMGLSANYPARPPELFAIQIVYTTLFTLELTLRILGRGCSVFCAEGCCWIWLDTLIVVISIWESAVEIAGESSGSLASVTSLKSFRLVRLTRLLRTVQFIRIFRFIMALRTLVTSIFSTLKALSWALILLFLIIYVFAILFTQSVNDYVRDPDVAPLSDELRMACDKYYGSMQDTVLTLFMSIAGGLSWAEAFAPLKAISAWWAVCYLFYICFTYFAVLNVVTAVFCQSAIESAQSDHFNMLQSMLENKEVHLRKIKALFSELGAEDTGLITFAMFEEKIDNPEVRVYFESLGLEMDDAWGFFKLLDSDGGGSVEIEEFFLGCLRFRGQARSMDVGKLIQDQRWMIRSMGRFQGYVEAELTCLREVLDQISHSTAASSQIHSRIHSRAAAMQHSQHLQHLQPLPSLLDRDM
mmetsp:Transcript_23498/g.55446  ORF Transcript_23498/g.55446 Transcript_23498/m.55446 type:complete len:598 (+) Transcript_23498:44-1837(+)